MSKTRTSSTGIRVLEVLKALKGQTVTGLSNKDLADAIGCPASAITRATADLIEAGLVVKLDNGRFAHSVQMLQIAQAHAEHVAKLQGRIAEINQRIAAGVWN
ncbi:IclR-like helix-turn-helix domain-containing protein [Microvirgula sp. AG722]|uniref:helix-turn-helix domain-containing protein n=1 Tax=Microvirgula sp. AG722 TaxID=2183901 RepID=UPI000DC57E13|nr:helix-turn-helix domain-containing protein [Microvirgula sp. AG722]RAS18912.1 IclR-like helix-turn-helix domain-containing protein [Microvirgula sp. AG722]